MDHAHLYRDFPWSDSGISSSEIGCEGEEDESKPLQYWSIYFHVYVCYYGVMKTAQDILGSKSSVSVLRVLVGAEVPLSISRIARFSGNTRPAVRTVLDRLERLGIVRATRAGNAMQYYLEAENLYVNQIIKPLFDLEDNLGRIIETDLEYELGPRAISVVLFGSFSRGEQNQESDIDVIAVVKDSLAKQKLEDFLMGYATRFYRKYGHPLNVIVYTQEEAWDLKRRAPALHEEIAQDGRIISGSEKWVTDG